MRTIIIFNFMEYSIKQFILYNRNIAREIEIVFEFGYCVITNKAHCVVSLIDGGSQLEFYVEVILLEVKSTWFCWKFIYRTNTVYKFVIDLCWLRIVDIVLLICAILHSPSILQSIQEQSLIWVKILCMILISLFFKGWGRCNFDQKFVICAKKYLLYQYESKNAFPTRIILCITVSILFRSPSSRIHLGFAMSGSGSFIFKERKIPLSIPCTI